MLGVSPSCGFHCNLLEFLVKLFIIYLLGWKLFFHVKVPPKSLKNTGLEKLLRKLNKTDIIQILYLL